MMFSSLCRRWLLPVLLTAAACSPPRSATVPAMPPRAPAADLLETMRITVPAADNRAVSFTNKAAAYYFTQTHATDHPEWAWFEGLNVAKNRVFGGYDLFVGEQKLDNRQAQVAVWPQKLVRRHGPALTEELWLLDDKNLLEIALTGTDGPVGLALKGEKVTLLRTAAGVAYFSAREGDYRIAVAPRRPGPIMVQGPRVTAAGEGFYVGVGTTEAAAEALVREGQTQGAALRQTRTARLHQLLRTNTYVQADDDSLTLALRWLATTTDQLVTRQQGDGIYAGLPWFNEYWGRDEFISLPGAVLVTGEFATARRMLLAFAQYQQLDPSSRFYGRVPNIVNPTSIDYHTTDGTPRFVIGLQDYVRYSGDTTLIRQLYPNVRASIEGALRYWVDAQGYLLHEDNETWMDARDAHHVAYTPRGTRANDIQALWYEQLQAGAAFAAYLHDADAATRWAALAARVKSHFARDFRTLQHAYLADRLDHQDRPDFTFRPNQLYALDLVDDAEFRRQVVRQSWQELVYPWGVASLSAHDPRFHPYHLAPELYHKDAAYHQGTIWLWNNGVAMQRMLEAGQTETAYQLFANMNRQALTRGVVGGLGENMDAYPRPGQRWPKLTGTYLQAWSNAEQLRVWYQYFLGIRPDLTRSELTLAPRLPAAIAQLNYHFKIGEGLVTASYQRGPAATHTYRFPATFTARVVVDVAPFAPATVAVVPGSVLELTVTEARLSCRLRDEQGRTLDRQVVTPSSARVALQQQNDAFFAGTHFAMPLDVQQHPVINPPKK
ncbi:hypothetical protein KLP40_05445 [Hymenobacter sp. NST-14]|uniref:amylo-alpha-1,6-glucosidase n=1 Tax=Hymenobacter piscis TaxID=2839984 RepID=UPI001C013375|nr:amylo-alpha-1,6-glucosidase [Hymenobacter piscis]MBT9392602.1 hypothetical protein [Hymenobacter piscis]